MKPIQLPLGVRLRDDATFANYYPGANAAALGYVERMCETDADWAENLIYLWGAARCRAQPPAAGRLPAHGTVRRPRGVPAAGRRGHVRPATARQPGAVRPGVHRRGRSGRRPPDLGGGAVPPVQPPARCRPAPAAVGLGAAARGADQAARPQVAPDPGAGLPAPRPDRRREAARPAAAPRAAACISTTRSGASSSPAARAA